MKVKMTICGRNLVVPLSTAEKIMELAFQDGEIAEEKWNRAVDGVEAYYSTHVYEINPSEFKFSLDVITEGQYQMYKLAGKPKN
jgi:hypothetical protein